MSGGLAVKRNFGQKDTLWAMSTAAGPTNSFACAFDPEVPDVLAKLDCSLAITTYQAGKLLFVSANGRGGLVQLARTFRRPMGLAVSGDRLVLACQNEVLAFSNAPTLATHYPKRPGVYDALFMPRVTYHTGAVDLHDVVIDAAGVIHAVNTAFSCIVRIAADHSFVPVWTPPFTSHSTGDDRCHLNGMADQDGIPRYATAFGTGDARKSWQGTIPGGGVLMDITTNQVVVEDLAMPHSPRLAEDRLFLLLSATGQVMEVDRVSGTMQEIHRLDGFVRGLAVHKGHLFVGLSALRKGSSSFGRMDLKATLPFGAVAIIDLGTGNEVGRISYQDSVEEIYDVQVMPGVHRPNVLNTLGEDFQKGLTTPEHTFWSIEPPKPKPVS